MYGLVDFDWLLAVSSSISGAVLLMMYQLLSTYAVFDQFRGNESCVVTI
jgi:hypothetical protein